MNFSKMFSINNLQATALRAKSTSSVDSTATNATASPTVSARSSANSKKSATAKIVHNQVTLTPEEEEKIIKEFVNIVNEIRAHQTTKNGSYSHPISVQNSRKFLSARKFELQRALSLYKAHEMIRLREGLVRFDLNSKSLRNELFSGKFTVLPNRDPVSGCCITLFSACKHEPLNSSHQITLQNIVLQLDVCISSVETQNNGIVFIYNMNNSKYANFDYELSQKILVLLKGAYPARLKKVLIVTPPLWFKTSFKILRLFVREKLRDRVYMLNHSQLKKHLPASCLPKELGGELNLEHEKWINHCLEQIKLIHTENNLDSLEDLNDLNKSFMFNCDMIGENISSFDTEDTDELDEFHKNSSHGDLSGLSEQLTGLCDNFLEQDLGVKPAAAEAAQNHKLVDLDDVKPDLNGDSKPASNGEPVPVKPALSNRTSLTIMKPKPENIPIRKINCDHSKLKNSLIKTASNGLNGVSVEEDDHYRLFKNYLVNNDRSLHLSTDPGMNLTEFIQHLRTKGRKGLLLEYSQLRHMKDLNFIFNNHENVIRFSRLKGSLKGVNGYHKAEKDDDQSPKKAAGGEESDQASEKSSNEQSSNEQASNEKSSNDSTENPTDVKPASSDSDENPIDLDNLDSRLSEKFNDLMSVFSFENSLLKSNLTKNRYTDVLCYDHTRVRLAIKDEDDFDDIMEEPMNPVTDYIHANYVDGYEQKRAFISTQGPLNSTCLDFWEMCIQNEVKVVVMTTRTMENQRIKCSQYWPLQVNTQSTFSYLTVMNTDVKEFQDYTMTKLTIKDNSTKKEHKLTHMIFSSWPDYGVPHSACAMLEFRQKVREELRAGMQEANWPEDKPPPPIVVHCSAGIGRTGTFITLDISILRLEETGLINIQSTVEKIRSQRANSVQMADQYVFCYLALLEHCIMNNMLENVNLDGFEDDSDSDDPDD